MDARGPKVIERDFEPGFRSRLHFKDLNIIMKTATDFNVPLPATGVVHSLFNALVALGRGDLDHSAVITVLEDLAGVRARKKTSS
jgi:2-hydroxy-3-oxopropionate reductase